MQELISVDEPGFSEEVAQPLSLTDSWTVLLKHRHVVIACIIGSLLAALLFSVISRRSYRAVVVLNVEKDTPSLVEVGSPQIYSAPNPEFLPTQTRLMQSREVADRVVKNLKSNPAGADADAVAALNTREVQENTSAEPVRGTTLIELSYISTSPVLAAAVANGIAEQYIQWVLESKFQVVGEASRFLSTQITQLKNEVAAKEKQLQNYGRKNDIISSDPQANGTLQNLEALNRDYAAAMGDRVAKEARFHELETAAPGAIADTLSNGLVSQLRSDQARLERDYAEKLNLYKANWPTMLQLKAQIDKGKQHLDSVVSETVEKARQAARTDYLTAQRREQNLAVVLESKKRQAMTLNSNAVEYGNLKVEVDTKRALLDKLLEQQAETEVTSRLRGQGVSNVRIVDRAVPPASAFRPSFKRNLSYGLLVGLMLGIGFAALLEYLDQSLRTTEQVERRLRLPALGIIPSVGSAVKRGYGIFRRSPEKTVHAHDGEIFPIELLPYDHPRTTAAEAYRAFRAALLLSRAGGVKSIVVTSSEPQEGKTSTSVNLAVVLSQLDKRVVVVDADLHRPRLHDIFHISNRVGLVSILAGNADASTAIQPTSIPNLFVIPSGPLSPNPSGLLASATMSNLIRKLSDEFDFVVVDTPPISLVADAILIGHEVDGVVLCTRGGQTPRGQVIKTRDRLIRSNVRILGVLINNLQEDPLVYGKYYQYYGDRAPYSENERGRGIA